MGTSFGRGGATTFQQDLQNSDCILIMGSNMAECHPVGFQWVMEAKARGATVIHVDPRFTRTSALAEDDALMVADLSAELHAESEEARGRLVLDMRSDRYIDLIERLVEASRAPALTAVAHQRAEVVVPALARRDWKELRKGVAALPDQPADSELHRIRILAKRVRYAAEAAEPIAGKIATRTAEAAAALQDVLGDHQDSVTVQQWLREAGRGPRAFVAGELTALERETSARDRSAWHNVWKKLDRKRLRRWMI